MFSTSLSFRLIILLFNGVLHEGSTWWIHQGFNSFSKCSSRFFSEELKYSLSCILKCNSFNRIIRGGIMSFLIIWVHVSWFTCGQGWGILNPSISSLELSWVYTSPKAFSKVCFYYVAYKWPKFFFYPPGDIAFPSPRSYQSNSFPVSGRWSTHDLRCIP